MAIVPGHFSHNLNRFVDLSVQEVICRELCGDSGVCGSDIKTVVDSCTRKEHLGCLSQQTFKINLTLPNMNIEHTLKIIKESGNHKC